MGINALRKATCPEHPWSQVLEGNLHSRLNHCTSDELGGSYCPPSRRKLCLECFKQALLKDYTGKQEISPATVQYVFDVLDQKFGIYEELKDDRS